jgi:hypothetical protein
MSRSSTVDLDPGRPHRVLRAEETEKRLNVQTLDGDRLA